MTVWLSWEPNENRTRLHAYTNRCRGCCDTQERHDRTYAPHSYCGKSWLPWRKAGEATARDNRWTGTAPECGSCVRVLRLDKLRAKIATAFSPDERCASCDHDRDYHGNAAGRDAEKVRRVEALLNSPDMRDATGYGISLAELARALDVP